MEERSIESACAMWDKGTINLHSIFCCMYMCVRNFMQFKQNNNYDVCYMALCISIVTSLHTIQSVKETQRMHLGHGPQKDVRK